MHSHRRRSVRCDLEIKPEKCKIDREFSNERREKHHIRIRIDRGPDQDSGRRNRPRIYDTRMKYLKISRG